MPVFVCPEAEAVGKDSTVLPAAKENPIPTQTVLEPQDSFPDLKRRWIIDEHGSLVSPTRRHHVFDDVSRR